MAELKLRQQSKRPHSKIEMCCQECGNTFFATNMGRICKACQSSQVIPVGRWLPVRDRRPKEQYGYVL